MSRNFRLIVVLLGIAPGFVEFAARRFAFDKQESCTVVVLDQNIGTAAAGTVTEFPFWFKLDGCCGL